jgi:hypothetical protein
MLKYAGTISKLFQVQTHPMSDVALYKTYDKAPPMPIIIMKINAAKEQLFLISIIFIYIKAAL